MTSEELSPREDASLKQMCPIDPFLVGLSPYFWSHLPMSIDQIHSLELIEGLHCMVFHDDDNHSNSSQTIHARPVSKCRLIGTVVAVDQRGPSGSVAYVVDDGTGVIDCFYFPPDDNDILPPLLESQDNRWEARLSDLETPRRTTSPLIELGSLVQVFGRIDCACVFDTPSRNLFLYGRQWQVRACVREIRSSSIQPIPIEGDVRFRHSEARHWQDVVRCKTDLRWSCCGSDVTQDNNPCKYLDAAKVVRFLGPDIHKQILDLKNLPVADDYVGAWQLFGSQCRCQTTYKEKLLYCHCIATRDESDPQLVYRDALLNRLLELEEQDSSEIRNSWGIEEPFRFQYLTIVNDPVLVAIEQALVNSFATTDCRAPQQQTTDKAFSGLGLAAFRALRADRILFLLDQQSDSYLLLSRKRSIESYLKRTMSSAQGSFTGGKQPKPPIYWSCIPTARVQYVKRTMYDSTSKEN